MTRKYEREKMAGLQVGAAKEVFRVFDAYASNNIIARTAK